MKYLILSALCLSLLGCGHKTDLKPHKPRVDVDPPTPVSEDFDRLPSGPM